MPKKNHDSYMQHEFDDHPSLASLSSAGSSPRQSPAGIDIPSTHSGFKSFAESTASASPTLSESAWSPPAWRKPPSGWFARPDHSRAGSTTHGTMHSAMRSAQSSPARSRETSPLVQRTARAASEDADADVTIPAHVPLPRSVSPERKRESVSPAKEIYPNGDEEFAPNFGGQEDTTVEQVQHNENNYIRFAVRAEIQHRTEPIESLITLLRTVYNRTTSSKLSILSTLSILILLLSLLKTLFSPLNQTPGPDLIKVAGLARSFEPLIHYSESGSHQVGELQETGVAVWDLGESVRSTNMTSAPIIVKELDELSDSLKTLAIELTRFFANVDGDIDSILIVMEWAKRELTSVSSGSQMNGKISSAYENIFMYMHKVGGHRFGAFMTELFGQTPGQIAKATLQRTFNEFLNVLEESINAELHYSTLLFGLFEAIDRQFLNLQRTVVREIDSQDAGETRSGAELAELWRQMIGSNQSRIKKYERNKALLASIKEKTVQNKLTLVDHNGKLLKLKSNLEILRRRLVSPLVRSNESSTLSVQDQIAGLDGTYEYLRGARERQKSKMMERLYGVGSKRAAIMAGEDLGIEAS